MSNLERNMCTEHPELEAIESVECEGYAGASYTKHMCRDCQIRTHIHMLTTDTLSDEMILRSLSHLSIVSMVDVVKDLKNQINNLRSNMPIGHGFAKPVLQYSDIPTRMGLNKSFVHHDESPFGPNRGIHGHRLEEDHH